MVILYNYVAGQTTSSDQEGHSHDHQHGGEHGHTHEIMDGPGLYTDRDQPVRRTDWKRVLYRYSAHM
jgi:urease accessory protein